jgi:hypothetical protein
MWARGANQGSAEPPAGPTRPIFYQAIVILIPMTVVSVVPEETVMDTCQEEMKYALWMLDHATCHEESKDAHRMLGASPHSQGTSPPINTPLLPHSHTPKHELNYKRL